MGFFKSSADKFYFPFVFIWSLYPSASFFSYIWFSSSVFVSLFLSCWPSLPCFLYFSFWLSLLSSGTILYQSLSFFLILCIASSLPYSQSNSASIHKFPLLNTSLMSLTCSLSFNDQLINFVRSSLVS